MINQLIKLGFTRVTSIYPHGAVKDTLVLKLDEMNVLKLWLKPGDKRISVFIESWEEERILLPNITTPAQIILLIKAFK